MNEELYFKDAFTEVDGNINLDINNLNASCITSKNNKFSLDSDGNLVVNSITTAVSNDSNIDFDMIYPVGSIYLSLLNTNPSTLFGGVWEQIAKGRTLVGVDTSQIEFNTVKKEGGSKTHSLTINEMPSHTHSQSPHSHNLTITKTSAGGSSYNGYLNAQYSGNGSYTYNTTNTTAVNNNTGGNGAHNNLQPYLTCYIWSRIS